MRYVSPGATDLHPGKLWHRNEGLPADGPTQASLVNAGSLQGPRQNERDEEGDFDICFGPVD